MFDIIALAQSTPGLDQVANFGMAGLMGAMWLWERRSNLQREQQIDDAHARILGDRVQLDQLIDVVRQNTVALTRLGATQEQLAQNLRQALSDSRVEGET